jgi:hypothetical protein
MENHSQILQTRKTPELYTSTQPSSSQIFYDATSVKTYDYYSLNVLPRSTDERLWTPLGIDIQDRVTTYATSHKLCTTMEGPFYVSDLWGKVSLSIALQVNHETQTLDT